jgi:hypothetical protein
MFTLFVYLPMHVCLQAGVNHALVVRVHPWLHNNSLQKEAGSYDINYKVSLTHSYI